MKFALSHKNNSKCFGSSRNVQVLQNLLTMLVFAEEKHIGIQSHHG